MNSAVFTIERSTAGSAWTALGNVRASGNSNSPRNYTFTDQRAGSGTFLYRLKITDTDGSSEYSGTAAVTVGIPEAYELAQNYPNPFNPETIIGFSLPEPGTATLRVYSVTGQLVKTLVHEYLAAGYHSVLFSGTGLSSGVYVYSLSINHKILTRRMLLVK